MKKKTNKVAVIYCSGGVRAKEKVDRKTFDGDCVSAEEKYPDGVLECSSGCLGFGSCAASCRFDAIAKNDFNLPEVDKEKCVGCGACVKVCPKSLIHLVESDLTIMPRCSNHDKGAEAKRICEVSCIACGICEKNCPTAAIQVIDNCAVIDEGLCVSCGMCAMKCPRGTIVDSDGIFSVR